MTFAPTPATLATIGAVLAVGGMVVGLTGFGYAIVGTATLAALLSPRTAVVLMLVPIMSANLSLASELDAASLRSCALRFWPYLVASVLGTLVGMALLERVPTTPLTLALGVLTLAYVAFTQDRLDLPGAEGVRKRCFGESFAQKVGLGAGSGFVFGVSNVGVQVVAYLRSRDLDRATFVGVMAAIFLGINAVRVVAAWLLGLYGDLTLLGVSVAAAIPGLVGVWLGKRARERTSESLQRAVVFALLSVIGAKLTLDGLGVDPLAAL